MNWLVVDKILKNGLIEDDTYGDITTSSIVNESSICSVELIIKENGIISGLEVFKRVFSILGNVDIKFNVVDGDTVKACEVIGYITGNTSNILVGERLALNLLQRMSGISTITKKLVQKIDGTNAKILDTRKTTPNLRILEKYAAKVGGACNHRFSLSDGVIIKDNHINAAGGITNAINMVKNSVSFVRKIEIEVENIAQVYEALENKVDIILLDNMSIKNMREAIKIINGTALVEASGNVNLDNIREIAETGVDFISLGMLTHSIKSLDISMKNLKIL